MNEYEMTDALATIREHAARILELARSAEADVHAAHCENRRIRTCAKASLCNRLCRIEHAKEDIGGVWGELAKAADNL